MTDYISREALPGANTNDNDYADGWNECLEAINAIPAADVRPVVRGKWVADGDGYHWTYNCSVCGWKDGYPFNERHNYCPNCGADMREES